VETGMMTIDQVKEFCVDGKLPNLDPILDKVVCGDCLDLMKMMPDKSVSLCLTDPPYGIGENNKQNLSRGNLCQPTDYGDYEWDKNRISPDEIRGILRVGVNQIIFGGNYYVSDLHDSNCWIVWDKDNGNNDFADCELAWTSFDSAVRKFKYRWNGMLQEPNFPKEKRVHPTQKPVALGVWCLENYSSDTDLIADFFCGSGSFLVAAKKLGRHFIGCEISEEYCRIAEARLRQADTGVSPKEQKAGQIPLWS
jgi:site-specific DNA-methyltransferase (adenine-specific)